MAADAPRKFVDWLCKHEHKDPTYGWVYQYHPRSDAHSVEMSKLLLEDLLASCPAMRKQAKESRVVYGINYKFALPHSKKTKTLDLVIGPGEPDTTLESVPGIYLGEISEVRMSCESKTAMTEHAKSQPRIFDELSSSHEIVHKGQGQQAIAAGLTVVNIADTFVSPLRQKSAELFVTKHKQPHAAQKMITHLRGLPIRTGTDEVGFDAYATIVVNCNNQGPATLHTEPPAPQVGEADEYSGFVRLISTAYSNRFGK